MSQLAWVLPCSSCGEHTDFEFVDAAESSSVRCTRCGGVADSSDTVRAPQRMVHTRESVQPIRRENSDAETQPNDTGPSIGE